MRPIHLEINQVRGIDRLSLPVRDLTTLIGPNNAGKSTVLDAIRLFHGDLEWDGSRDRPWRADNDDPTNGSYVEVTYELDLRETHEAGFHAVGDRLRLRRYFTSTFVVKDDRGRGQNYGPGKILSLPEYGTWATLEGSPPWPLGSCVYVPALPNLADHTRMAESSVLREVMRRALDDAAAASAMRYASAALARHLREVLEDEGGPARRLERRLSEALTPWRLNVHIDVTGLTPEIILDRMLRLHVAENGHLADLSTQGTGVQRVALAALIQAASELSDEDAGFTWVLFEEPETHLHPAHIGRLGDELARLARTGRTSVMATTHSTSLLAAQGGLDSIVRLHDGRAAAPSDEDIQAATASVSRRSAYMDYARRSFRHAPRVTTAAQTNERMLRDLDGRRAAAFFADRVIVVEGFSDCTLFEWLERRGLLAPLGANVGVLDADGKYELHRAITTLSLFGIPHVVLWDEDAVRAVGEQAHQRPMWARQDEAAWQAVRAAANDTAADRRPAYAPNGCTAGGVRLSGTIEGWLGVHQERDNAWKAANLATALDDAFRIPDSQVRRRATALVALLADLFDGKPPDAHRQAACFQDCLIAPPFPAATVDFQNPPTG